MVTHRNYTRFYLKFEQKSCEETDQLSMIDGKNPEEQPRGLVSCILNAMDKIEAIDAW